MRSTPRVPWRPRDVRVRALRDASLPCAVSWGDRRLLRGVAAKQRALGAAVLGSAGPGQRGVISSPRSAVSSPRGAVSRPSAARCETARRLAPRAGVPHGAEPNRRTKQSLLTDFSRSRSLSPQVRPSPLRSAGHVPSRSGTARCVLSGHTGLPGHTGFSGLYGCTAAGHPPRVRTRKDER